MSTIERHFHKWRLFSLLDHSSFSCPCVPLSTPHVVTYYPRHHTRWPDRYKSQFLFVTKADKLFIAFKDCSKHLKQERIQLQNHLKLSQHSKQFSIKIWKQTVGWMCESIGCFGLIASQPPKTVFNLSQNT